MLTRTYVGLRRSSNVALCVNPEFKYVKMKNPENGKVYIVAESRLSAIPGAVATAGTFAIAADALLALNAAGKRSPTDSVFLPQPFREETVYPYQKRALTHQSPPPLVRL